MGTEGQGQAKDILAVMERSDAVLVAGGDGTLMETATGLLRRPDLNAEVVLGVLPLGSNNLMAKTLFPLDEGSSEVKRMAEATMAVVRQLCRPVSLIEVENVELEKRIHGFRQVQVGGLKDAEARRDKYWYLPFIKKYLTYFFSYYSSAKNLVMNCQGSMDVSSQIRYEMAAVAHNDAAQTDQDPSRSGFWSYIVSSQSSPTSVLPVAVAASPPQPTRVYDWQHLSDTNVSEIVIQEPSNCDSSCENKDGMTVYMPPNQLEMADFVAEGWSREFNQRPYPTEEWRVTEGAKGLMWTPQFDHSEEDEKVFYLDNEQVEIRGPVRVTHLPERLRMFCCEGQHQPQAVIRDDGAPKQSIKKQLFKMQTPSIANKFMV